MLKINKESSIKLNKKQVMALAVAALLVMNGTACGKKLTDDTTMSQTTTTASTTTTTTSTPETTVVTSSIKYEEEANKLYEDNKDFFVRQYGNDKEYAIKEINNIMLVITNDSETITNEDLRNTFYAMDNIFMPVNVIQQAGNYMTDEALDNDIPNVPNLGRYIEDDRAKQIINDNNAIVNNFINAMNNGTDEEKAKARELVLKRVIYFEENHDDILKELGELSNGDELALNMSFKGLVNLGGSLVTNGVLNYTDKNGVDQTMFLIADAYGAAVLNSFRFAEEEGLPYDTKEIDGAMVNGRYIEYLGPDGFERKFVTIAEKNTIEDTLAITKYDEVIYNMESEYSRISTEYYSLNSDCNTKTL